LKGRPSPWPWWLSDHRLIECFISVNDPDLDLFMFLPSQHVRTHPAERSLRSLHRPRLAPSHTPPNHGRHHICRYEESSSWNPKIERDRRTSASLTDRYLSFDAVVEWCGPVREGGRTEDPRTFMWHASDFPGPVASQCSAAVSERGPKTALLGGVISAAESSLTPHHPGFSGSDSIQVDQVAGWGPLMALSWPYQGAAGRMAGSRLVSEGQGEIEGAGGALVQWVQWCSAGTHKPQLVG